MQSSAGKVLRAFLLLACMIAIPLAALWGSSLPTIVSSLLEGRWPQTVASNRQSRLPIEVAQFEPMAPAATAVKFQSPAEPALLRNDPSQAVTASDRFAQIQGRLRQLGATYCLLESWGNQPDYYRFFCKMAVAGNPNFVRPFQATHSDPLQAMADVVQQVEAWRASRSFLLHE